MVLSTYQKLALRYFGRIARSAFKRLPTLKHDLDQAHMDIRPEIYFAIAFFNTFIALVAGSVAFIVLFFFTPEFSVRVQLISIGATLPIVATVVTFVVHLALPSAYKSVRARAIELEIGPASAFMGIMASANVEIPEIFRGLAEKDIYGEIQKEAEWIDRDIRLGQDIITALHRAEERSPAKQWSDLLGGMITITTSGGDMKTYLKSKSDYFNRVTHEKLEERVEFFGTLATGYIIAGVVAPLLVITILMIMAMFSGEEAANMSILAVFILVFIALPLMHIVFSILIHSLDPIKIQVPAEFLKYRDEILAVSFMIVALFIVLAALFPQRQIDFILFGIMSFVGPYPFYETYQMRRIDRIEERFPDFLRDIAEDRKVGMSLMHAVRNAAEEDYGTLTKWIKKMANLLSWNVPFVEVLRRFTENLPTPMVTESMGVIEKGFESGGSITDVFVDTAENARDRRQLFIERESTMGMYLGIIYLAFIVFLGVIVVLVKLFLPIMAEIESPDVGEGDPGMMTLVNIGGMFSKGPPTQFYQNILILAIYIQSIGTGAVCGVLIRRRFISGLRHSFLMMLIAYVTVLLAGV